MWYVKNVYKHFFCIQLCYVKLQKPLSNFSHLIGEVGIFGVCEDILKRLSIFQRFFIVQNNDVERKRIYFIHYTYKVHMI